MAETAEQHAEQRAVAAAPQRIRPPWRRRMVAPAAVVLAALAVWWFVHPGSLNAGGFGGIGAYSGEDFLVDAGLYPALEDGEPLPASAPLRILSLQLDHAGPAEHSFLVCTLVPDQGRIGSVYTRDEPGALCTSLVPFEPGQTVDLATQQVLVRVTSDPGAVAVLGPLAVAYVDGVRPGRQVLQGVIEVGPPQPSAP